MSLLYRMLRPLRHLAVTALLLTGSALAAAQGQPAADEDAAALAKRIGASAAHGRGDPHATLSAEQRIHVALQHREAGRDAQAYATLEEAIIVMPGNSRLRAVRGSLYLEDGRPSEALADLEVAVELTPDDALARTNRARAYAMFERFDESLADLDHALRVEPALLPARFNRGTLRYQRGDYNGALEDFTECVAVDPHAAAPYFNRAIVLDALGRRDEAIADMRHLLDLDISAQADAAARQQLESWSGNAASDGKSGS